MQSIIIKFAIEENDHRFSELHKELSATESKRHQSRIILEMLITGAFEKKYMGDNFFKGSITIQISINEYSPCLGSVYASISRLHDHSSRVAFLKHRLSEIISGSSAPTKIQKLDSDPTHSSQGRQIETIPSSVKSIVDSQRGVVKSQLDQFNNL